MSRISVSEIKKLILKNSFFLIPYAFLSGVVFYILLSFDKKSGHLFLTSFHNSFMDSFFAIITHIGDGIFVLIAGLFMLSIRIKHGFLILISYSLSGLLVQLLKYTIFDDFERPFIFFKDPSVLHLVDGVNINIHNSFPSGHSTSAFALFFALSILTKNKYLKFIAFLFASTVAYSRVYLSQHFLIDIWMGSVLGIIFTFIIWLILKNSSLGFLNKSLFYR